MRIFKVQSSFNSAHVSIDVFRNKDEVILAAIFTVMVCCLFRASRVRLTYSSWL